jgi:hypothetical protein
MNDYFTKKEAVDLVIEKVQKPLYKNVDSTPKCGRILKGIN